MHTERIELPAPAPGHTRALTVHTLGSGPRKAYLQAALHADEWPGLLVLQHVLERLIKLEQAGKLLQRIVIVPYANPVGMNQRLFGYVPGRFDAVTGQNFNRGMSVDPDAVLEKVREQLGSDAEHNDRVMRETLHQMALDNRGDYEIQALHSALLSQSLDANIMLDLHCDDEALPHVFYGDHQRETGKSLGDCLGFPVRLEEDVRGVVAFDGTHTQPWVKVAEATGAPFAEPCFAATLELRGSTAVSDELARRDAEGILAFLEQQGYLSDSGASPQPQAHDTVAVNVDQVKVIKAADNGLITYRKDMGERVEKGEHIGDIVLLDRDTPERVPVTAPATGFLFTRTVDYLVYPGSTLGMIASDERQIEPGQQLSF
ncbi:MAG: M14 family metallopeptidase [Natronospirillum sp.]|uniref:succinylglutamate desuccinylase/aspartoacylase family protein n=1 Tax=Natronospirillum sp. TaxID=2812955 RepID=UPI0025F2C563|nr:succinylglutamate desuccinylase/aspartoacylase family protein [Natronospirillum sp.]MCH8550314.1 M14 family metallopeptidase [Natronospirillum sp.]